MNRAARSLLAVGWCALWGGSVLSAEPPPATGPLATVLAVARLHDADLLLLRNGTRMTGIVGQATFGLYTSHGELALRRETLAGLDLTDRRNGFCTAITEAGDRLSGFLAATTLNWQASSHEPTGSGGARLPPSRPAADTYPARQQPRPTSFMAPGQVQKEQETSQGAPQEIGREDVLKVLFRLRPASATPFAPDCLVRLRNGDFLLARWLEGGGRFKVVESGAVIDWSAEAPGAVTFPEPDTDRARVVLGDGRVVDAEPVTRVFRFELAGGLRVGVASTRVDQLERLEAAELPADLLARIGAPPRGSSARQSPEVTPPSGVIPGEGMVWISPGAFEMGSAPDEQDRDLDEGPLTHVVIPAGFWIGRHEVTQREYLVLMGQNPSQYQYEGEVLHPVERVSWHDAMDYCRRLTERERQAGNIAEDHAYRLPTEAEWEYACRAGTTSRFSFGDDAGYAAIRDFVWYSRNSDSTTHPVGTKRPNLRGLHDMHGNVLEWCLDAWRGTLPGGTHTNLAVAPEGSLRAVRGGSWLYDARYARSANRDSYGAMVRCSDLGFRVVLAPRPVVILPPANDRSSPLLQSRPPSGPGSSRP